MAKAEKPVPPELNPGAGPPRRLECHDGAEAKRAEAARVLRAMHKQGFSVPEMLRYAVTRPECRELVLGIAATLEAPPRHGRPPEDDLRERAVWARGLGASYPQVAEWLWPEQMASGHPAAREAATDRAKKLAGRGDKKR